RHCSFKILQTLCLASAEKICPAERRVGAIVSRIELHCILGRNDSLVVTAGADQRRYAIQSVSERIQLVRATLQRNGIIEPRERRTQAPVQDISVGAAGTQLDRALEFRLGAGPIELVNAL